MKRAADPFAQAVQRSSTANRHADLPNSVTAQGRSKRIERVHSLAPKEEIGAPLDGGHKPMSRARWEIPPRESASGSECLKEVAGILAAGLVRLRARKSSQFPPVFGESPLDFSGGQSGHGRNVWSSGEP